MKKLMYLKDVVTLELERDLCNGCGLCLKVCPREVLTLENKRAAITDRDACMECGACALNCPTQALSVDSGVGCAAAIISGKVGRKSACC